MAGITFNLILIRVYKDRLRLTHSNAGTGGANGVKPLSGLRFGAAHSTTTNDTTPESDATHQVDEEYRAEEDGDVRGD